METNAETKTLSTQWAALNAKWNVRNILFIAGGVAFLMGHKKLAIGLAAAGGLVYFTQI